MIMLPKEVAQEMIAQAKGEAPYEACGIIAGKEGRAVRLYRTANAEQSTTTYRLEPEEQYKIFVEMEKKGWELWAIYHSHPAFPAYPSARDIEQAYFPEALYIIVSLAQEEPEIRAFRIVEGKVREEELVIE
jgi:proteasome lid subunit RPN8/RPN11